MKKKLLNVKELPPSCSYCIFGRPSPDGESILCIKRGVMLLTSSCHKFKYNPLKRKPQRAQSLPKMEQKDFEI